MRRRDRERNNVRKKERKRDRDRLRLRVVNPSVDQLVFSSIELELICNKVILQSKVENAAASKIMTD